MYEAFYGFKEKPFSMLPDPGFLYLSKKHQAALTLLEYGLLNHVGFCVISGEAGAGKTTILRALLERIEDNVTVGLITNTHQSFGGLLDWVLSAFDLHQPGLTHVEMHQVFMEYLIEEYANGRTVLLIVDEAQNMKPDALEELRMLSNVNSEKDQLMQVVLAGQPTLKETLRLPDLMQFAQRIAVDYHLEALSLEETCGYIQHRLTVAGAQKDVFTPAACERIHNYSGGTPRLINLLCETVLVYGFADQQEMIDVGLVDEMVLERMKDSVVPIVNRDVATRGNKAVSKELEKDFPWIQPGGGSKGLKPAKETVSPASDQIKKPQATQKKTGTDEESVKQPVKNKAAIKKEVAAKVPEQRTPEQQIPEQKTPEQEPSESTMKSRPVAADNVIFSSQETVEKNQSEDGKAGTKSLFKYGAVATVATIILVLAATVLDGEKISNTEPAADKKIIASDLQSEREREQEEERFRQLQIEAENLKKERDAAIAKIEEEKQKKRMAEKLAAEKAMAAARAAEEKRRLAEKKRLEIAKQRERQAKEAEVKAREDASRAQREAAKLKEQRRVMQIRLDEERRLKKLEEARRQELEKQQARLKAAREAEMRAQQAAAAEAAKKSKVKSAECSGPTARFRSGCR